LRIKIHLLRRDARRDAGQRGILAGEIVDQLDAVDEVTNARAVRAVDRRTRTLALAVAADVARVVHVRAAEALADVRLDWRTAVLDRERVAAGFVDRAGEHLRIVDAAATV